MPITDWGAHVSWLRGKPLRWWAYNTTQVVLYLLLASVPVALEKWSQSRSEGGEGGSDSGGILSLPFRYSWFTHPGFAQTEPQVVQLVTYGEKDAGGELVSESCQRRKLLMRIIQAVQTQKVRLIVLDFSFAPTRCDINPQLEHVIRTSSVPLVIGLRTEEADERTDGEALLQPSEAMIQDDTGVVKRGLLRLNSDTRKIPLEWPMRVNMRTEEGTIERFPTLSLVAATQFIAMKYGNPERLPPRLTRQLESGTHPYASFLPRGSIPTTSALKLLCGDGPVENWKNCALPRDQRLSGMPIVVVGEESSRDEHYLSEDAIGAESRSNHRSGLPKKVYGVWLQANYIENLVQGSYLKSAGPVCIWVTNFVWLILVELAFRFHLPLRALVYSVLMSTLFSFGAYLVALQWGWYLPLWSVEMGIIVPLVLFVDELRHMVAHNESPSSPPVATNAVPGVPN